MCMIRMEADRRVEFRSLASNLWMRGNSLKGSNQPVVVSLSLWSAELAKPG